jgi:hypothetical protein
LILFFGVSHVKVKFGTAASVHVQRQLLSISAKQCQSVPTEKPDSSPEARKQREASPNRKERGIDCAEQQTQPTTPNPFISNLISTLISFLTQTTHTTPPRKTHVLNEEVAQIGSITHFFSKISVAIIELTAPINVGETILIKGPTTDFEQVVDSMQIEHQNVQHAEKGQSIGLKLSQPVKEKDVVYKKK